MMDLIIRILAYYTVVAMFVAVGISIWRVGETREQSRKAAVITFIGFSIVAIFAIFVLVRG